MKKVHAGEMGIPLCNKRGEVQCLTMRVFQRKGTKRCRDCRRLLRLIHRTRARLTLLQH